MPHPCTLVHSLLLEYNAVDQNIGMCARMDFFAKVLGTILAIVGATCAHVFSSILQGIWE